MEPHIKQHLITRPLILAALGGVLGIAFPHFASTLIAMVTERGFYTNAGETFSGLTYLVFIVLFASVGIKKLLQNLQLIKEAESGNCPSCPVCGFPMIQRKEQNAYQRSHQYWGCCRFPECEGRRDVNLISE